MSKAVPKVPMRRSRRSGRRIQTVYYIGNKLVKRNLAKYATTAVTACVKHMQLNSYEATHAEVYDIDDGELHAVIKAALVKGKHEIHILFKREIQEER